MTFSIRAAAGREDFTALGALFRDYAAELGIDLSFQDFDAELAGLETFYEAAFLAEAPSGEFAGCVPP